MRYILIAVRVLFVCAVLWIMLLTSDPWTMRLGGY